jgi:hypothetical protein
LAGGKTKEIILAQPLPDLFVFLKTIINVKLRILAKRKSKEAYFALNNSKT